VSGQPPTPAGPPPPSGTLRCPRCSATVGPEQDWCLECGAPARTRLAQTPNWQLPTVAIGAIVLVAGAMLAFAFVKLTGDGGAPAATPPAVTTAAPAAAPPIVVPPVATTPGPAATVVPTTPTTTPTQPTTTATPPTTSTIPGKAPLPQGPTATTSTTTAPPARTPPRSTTTP
jgi:hypothetical protein